MTGVLKEEVKRQTHKRGMLCDDEHIDWTYMYKPRNAKDCQDYRNLEETRMDSPIELFERA